MFWPKALREMLCKIIANRSRPSWAQEIQLPMAVSVSYFGGCGFAMLEESPRAVCQLVLAHGCSLSAARDVGETWVEEVFRQAWFYGSVPSAGRDKIFLFDRLGARIPSGKDVSAQLLAVALAGNKAGGQTKSSWLCQFLPAHVCPSLWVQGLVFNLGFCPNVTEYAGCSWKGAAIFNLERLCPSCQMLMCHVVLYSGLWWLTRSIIFSFPHLWDFGKEGRWTCKRGSAQERAGWPRKRCLVTEGMWVEGQIS